MLVAAGGPGSREPPGSGVLQITHSGLYINIS